ncbi:MAG: hypothetical protein K6F00_10315 [Lachnospiraceae bacterium]|nr:hypothetical protein [Lachnospiraceae bacterium]
MDERPDDKEIYEVLKRYEELMTCSQREITSSFLRLAEIINDKSKDDMIKAISLSTSDEMKVQEAGQVLDEYQYFVRKESTELKLYIRELIKRRERMNRIMACYRALPEWEREILGEFISSDDGTTNTCRDLEKKYFKDRSTILRARKKALEKIQETYESKITTKDFYRQRRF